MYPNFYYQFKQDLNKNMIIFKIMQIRFFHLFFQIFLFHLKSQK